MINSKNLKINNKIKVLVFLSYLFVLYFLALVIFNLKINMNKNTIII